ncbi:MAG TPA: XRE family transcriptional regulator [Clostridiales bacterium]|nr:XRE family transcriptional regulator [Clostridiales bacterium]
MSDQIQQIAERIAGLRDIAGYTVEELAKDLGISVEEYKRYESGEVDIPIGFLYKLASKYNVELTAILTGDEPKLRTYCLVRKGKGVNVERKAPYKYHSLAFNFVNKKAEPFEVCVEPSSDDEPIHLSSHPGQEFNYVIEGSMVIYIDGHHIVLNEGDSLYFDSSYSHGMKALGNKPAKFLAIIIQDGNESKS